MTKFQLRFLERLKRCRGEIESTTNLANKLGTSRVAVAAAGYALERAGHIWSMRSDDSEHAALMWVIRTKPTETDPPTL